MVSSTPLLLLTTLAASAAAQTRTTVYPVITQYCAILVGAGETPVPGDCLESSTKTLGSTTVTEVLVTGTVTGPFVNDDHYIESLTTYYSQITAGAQKAPTPNNATATVKGGNTPVSVPSASSSKKQTSAMPVYTGAAAAPVAGERVARVAVAAAGIVGVVAGVL